MNTNQEIIDLISAVKHPAIDHTLVDLGIVRDINVFSKTVVLEFAFPFPNIPIADALVNSIEAPLNDNGYRLLSEIITMNEQEKARFLQMETEAWKG